MAAGDTVEVVLNGDAATLDAGLTLGTWLESIGRDARTVAVERNGAIVPRSAYGETPIADGDRLEVVHFVQGG